MAAPSLPEAPQRTLYEAGDDTTVWFAKVVPHKGQLKVVVYDADCDIRPEFEMITLAMADAKAYADQVVVNRGLP